MRKKDKSHPFMVIGGTKFTAREVEVLAFILQGRSAKKVASLLSLSPKTIENYHYNIRSKLECNSREDIRDFLERSDQALFLKRYYSFLIFRGEFEQRLKECGSQRSEHISCKLISWERDENSTQFLSEIERYLSLAGITLHIQPTNKPKSLKAILKDIDKDSSIEPSLYYLPIDTKIDCEANELSALQKDKGSILILKQGSKKSFFTFPEYEFSDIESTINFYFSLSNIFEHLLPNLALKDLLEKVNHPQEFSKDVIKQNKTSSPYKKLKPSLYALGLVVVLGLGYSVYESNTLFTSYNDSVRSDLVLPVRDTLLDRSELISQLNEKFKEQKGTHTVALVGPGGAGKTTTARVYAHDQKAKVVWEVNAETPESLSSSFESLAQALARTEEDKKSLADIESIKNPNEQKNRIILFVKEHLKLTPNWLLVFDNVESFTDIQKYFPNDPETWGEGNVLITTRDSNIQSNAYINEVIPIGELTNAEKSSFFMKVMKQGQAHAYLPIANAELNNLLKKIPSYPLDVSLAAYYIKSTHIPFKAYLDSLSDYHQEFLNVQEQLLKENGDYLKTRYSIVNLSIQKLIETRKEFVELLFILSLLDSQNIPVGLLKQYTNPFIVDDFIRHLKKYSLITNENLITSEQISTLSLHRSTQTIALDHLKKILGSEKLNNLIEKMSKTLASYADKAVDAPNLTLIKFLLRHYERLLQHKTIVPHNVMNVIKRELGYLYYQIDDTSKMKTLLEDAGLDEEFQKGDISVIRSLIFLGAALRESGEIEKSKTYLEKSLRLCKQDPTLQKELGQTLIYLGNTYREVGNYSQAIEFLSQGVVILERLLPHSSLIYAQALGYLGVAYWFSGKYVNAQKYLEDSYRIYREASPANPFYLSWAGSHTGNIYGELGYYDKGRDILIQNLETLKLFNSSNERGYSSLLLGNLYRKRGEYTKALPLMEEGYKILQKVHPDNQIRLAEATFFLGILKGEMGDFEASKKYLNSSLKAYETNFGKEHVQYGRVLGNLGKTYLLEGKLDQAEVLLNKSLEILEKNGHGDTYLVLEDLAELYHQKSLLKRNNGDLKGVEDFDRKSNQYLTKAEKWLIDYYPEDSPHFKRIQLKLQSSGR